MNVVELYKKIRNQFLRYITKCNVSTLWMSLTFKPKYGWMDLNWNTYINKIRRYCNFLGCTCMLNRKTVGSEMHLTHTWTSSRFPMSNCKIAATTLRTNLTDSWWRKCRPSLQSIVSSSAHYFSFLSVSPTPILW